MHRGETAAVRHVWRGHVASVLPMTIVDDTAERVVTYLRHGTPIRWVDGDRLPDWVARGCRTVAKAWEHTDVVAITPYGRAHTVWAMWEADQRSLSAGT